MYADNILLYLKDPGSSVPRLVDVLQTFETYSGYVLNFHKTQVLVYNYTPCHTLAIERLVFSILVRPGCD
jgi:hypothetical protein